jgi:hypothetical protein
VGLQAAGNGEDGERGDVVSLPLLHSLTSTVTSEGSLTSVKEERHKFTSIPEFFSPRTQITTVIKGTSPQP